MKFAVVVLAFLSLFVGVVESRNETWDHFLFVQQWPQSLCIAKRATGKECSIPQTINYWTIHGLWPTSGGKHSPAHCVNVTFDENLIKDLLPQMNLFWADLLSTKDLWEHEWSTHGTCAMSVNATRSEYLFFRTTLTLRKKYDLKSLLEKCKIVPSSNRMYKATIVRKCIAKSLGKEPDLRCYTGENKKTIFSEIRLCIDKSLQLMDCEEPPEETLQYNRGFNLHPCGSESAYYPSIVHH